MSSRIRHRRRAGRTHAALLGEPRHRRSCAAHPRSRPQRGSVVADRRCAGPDHARDHLRPSRDRAVRVDDVRVHHGGDGGRRRLDPRRPGHRPRSSLRVLARRHGRPAGRASPPRVVSSRSSSAVRIPVGAARRFPSPRSWRSSDGARAMPSEEAAWASVPYNYGPRSRTEQVDRIAEDIERRLAEPLQRARLPSAAARGVAAQLLSPSGADPRADAGRPRRARSDHPGRQRAHDRGAGAGSAAEDPRRMPATSTRPRSRRSTRPSGVLRGARLS